MGPLFLKEVCTNNEIESADAGEWIELWKRATEGKTVITDNKYEGHTLAEIIRNIPTRLLKGKVFVVRGQEVRHVDKCLDDFLEFLEAAPVAKVEESKEEVVETKDVDTDSENEESDEGEVDSDEEEKIKKKKKQRNLRDKIRSWNKKYFKTTREPAFNTIDAKQKLIEQMEPLKDLAVQIQKFEENFRIGDETKAELENILQEYKDKKELDDLNKNYKTSETDLQTAKEKIAVLKEIHEFQKDFKIGDESVDELKTKLNELRRDNEERKGLVSEIRKFDNEYSAGRKTIEKLKEDLETNKLWAEIKTLVDKYFDPTNLGPLKLPKSIYRGNLEAVKELVKKRGRIVEEIWKLTETKDKQPAAEPKLNSKLSNLKKEKQKKEKAAAAAELKKEREDKKKKDAEEKAAEKARLQKEREDKKKEDAEEKQKKAAEQRRASVAKKDAKKAEKRRKEEAKKWTRKKAKQEVEDDDITQPISLGVSSSKNYTLYESTRKEYVGVQVVFEDSSQMVSVRAQGKNYSTISVERKKQDVLGKSRWKKVDKFEDRRHTKTVEILDIGGVWHAQLVHEPKEIERVDIAEVEELQPYITPNDAQNVTLKATKDDLMIAHIPGKGKTYAAILKAEGVRNKCKDPKPRILVVAPKASIVAQWQKEVIRFGFDPRHWIFQTNAFFRKTFTTGRYVNWDMLGNSTQKMITETLWTRDQNKYKWNGTGEEATKYFNTEINATELFQDIIYPELVKKKKKQPYSNETTLTREGLIKKITGSKTEYVQDSVTNKFIKASFIKDNNPLNWNTMTASEREVLKFICSELKEEKSTKSRFYFFNQYQEDIFLQFFTEGTEKKKTTYYDVVENKEYDVDGPAYVFFTNLQYGNYLEKLKRDAENTSEKGQDDTTVMDFPDYNGESPFRRKNIRGKKQKPEGWSTTDYISDTFLKFVEKHHKIEAPNEEDCFRDFKVKQELIRSRRLRKDVKIDVLDKFVVPSHGKSVSQHRYRPESNTIFILDEAHEPEAITNNIYKVSTRLILNYCQNTVCNIMVTATPMQSEYPQRQLWTFSQLFQGKTYDELRKMLENEYKGTTEIKIAKSMEGFISRSFEMQPLQKSEFLENIFFDNELAKNFNDIIKMRQWGTVEQALLKYVNSKALNKESRKNILKALADEIIPVAQPNPEKVTSFPTKLKMFTRFDRGRWQVEMDSVRKNICQYAKKDYEGGESVYIDYTAHVQKGVSDFTFLEQESKELCEDGVVPIVIEPSGISVDTDIGIMQYLFRRAFQNENKKLIVPILATKDKAKEYLGKVLLKRFTTSQKEPDRIIDRRLGELHYYLEDNRGEGDYPQWASIDNKYCPNLQSSKFIEIAKLMKEKDRAHCNGLVYHKNYEIQYGLASVMEGFGFKRIKSTELNTIDLDNVKRKILRKWEVYSTQDWTPDKEIERLKNWGALIRNASTSKEIRDMIRKLGKDLEQEWHQPNRPGLIEYVKEMGQRGVQKVYRLKKPAPISTFGAYETVSDGVKYEGVVKSKGNIGGPTYKFGARWIEPATKLEYKNHLSKSFEKYGRTIKKPENPDLKKYLEYAIQTYDENEKSPDIVRKNLKDALRYKNTSVKTNVFLKSEQKRLKEQFEDYEDDIRIWKTDKRETFADKLQYLARADFIKRMYDETINSPILKEWNKENIKDFLNVDIEKEVEELEIPDRETMVEASVIDLFPEEEKPERFRSQNVRKNEINKFIKEVTRSVKNMKEKDKKKLTEYDGLDVRYKGLKLADVQRILQNPLISQNEALPLGRNKRVPLGPVYDRMFALDDDTFSTYAFYNGKDTPTTTRRDDVRNLFEAGILDWIIMSDAGITGVDFKSLRQSVCIMVSAGRSPGIEDQFVGRMVRENSHDLVPRLFQRVDHVTFYNTWEKESKDKTKTKLKKPRSQGVGESKSAEAFDLDELLEDMPSVTRSGKKKQVSSIFVELTDKQKELLEVMRKEQDFLKLTDEEQEILDDASEAERNAVLPMLLTEEQRKTMKKIRRLMRKGADMSDDEQVFVNSYLGTPEWAEADRTLLFKTKDDDFSSDSESDGELSEEESKTGEVLYGEKTKEIYVPEEKTKKKAVSGKLHTIVDSQIDNHVRISKVIQWGNRVFPTVNAYLKREPKEKVFVCHVCQYKNENKFCQNCGVYIHDRYLHMEPQKVSSADVIYPDVQKGRWVDSKTEDAWTREENIMWNRRDGFDSQMRRRDRLSFYLMFSTVEHLIRQQHDQVVSYTHDTGAIYTRVKIKDIYAKENRGKQWYELIGLGEEVLGVQEEEYEYESEYSD